MSRAFTRSAPWVTLCGVVMLLLGLGWDARLHLLNPELAAEEGIFSLTNPAHLLFGFGLMLAVLGSALWLAGPALAHGAPLGRRLVRGGLALALTSGAALTYTSASAGSLAGGHVHTSVADMGHSHAPVDLASVTLEQRAAAQRLVDDTRTGTARLADFNVAQAEGYRQGTPFLLGFFGQAHFSNPAYLRDGRWLDPTKPEGLVYYEKPNGQMVLLGALFIAPRGQGPAAGGPLTAWHSHPNLCVRPATGMVALSLQPGQCPSDAVLVGDRIEMMHVWTNDRLLHDNPVYGGSGSLAPGQLIGL